MAMFGLTLSTPASLASADPRLFPSDPQNFVPMITKSTHRSGRFDFRLLFLARALLAVSASAAQAVSPRLVSRSLKSVCLAAVLCGSFGLPSQAATQSLTILGGSGNAGDLAPNTGIL
jgi:hypothetical protein